MGSTNPATYILIYLFPGFPPRQEFLGIELTVVYNYCYTYGLLKLLGTNDSCRDAKVAVYSGVQKSDSVYGKQNPSDMESVIDDVIARCAERRKQFFHSYY
jgi:hypothetical protein